MNTNDYDYWKSVSDKLISEYESIMKERNFKFDDYKIGYPLLLFDTVEHERRYHESLELIVRFIHDTNTFPKNYKGYIKSSLKKI